MRYLRRIGWVPLLLAACTLNSGQEFGQASGQGSASRDVPVSDVQAAPTLAPSPTAAPSALQQEAAALPDYGPAPELHDGIWLNTTVPLKLADLRGSVVLLEMWTFECINCIHTIPTVRDWYDQYHDQGLVVIGNHYPEFSYEANLDNLRAALIRLDIPYPVLQDNGRQTWDAYHNRYWPTMYVIDKRGHIRYSHIGEGAYDRTGQVIQALLAEDYTPPESTPSPGSPSLTATESLNVRGGPGVDYPRIGGIHPDEAYYILDEQDGWYRILFDGAEAWVSGDYVVVSGADAQS